MKIAAIKKITNPFAKKITDKAFMGDLYRDVEGELVGVGDGFLILKTDNGTLEQVNLGNCNAG